MHTTPIDKTHLLAVMTTSSGVYQMRDAHDQVLYVGKARNLKNRVASYFDKQHASAKTQRLMEHVCDIQVIVTESETEALILEHTLIKKYKPRYNVLFRDDKTFPYIHLDTSHAFPRLTFYRGRKVPKGHYFGPYPQQTAVRDTLKLLQKLFQVRQCSDVFYSHRTRPCLQYQIGRCRAPCVGLVDSATYQQDVAHTVMFLQGKDQQVLEHLRQAMEQAAVQQHYEQAALYRDQIASLQRIQEQQYVSTAQGDADVLAVVCMAEHVCVQLLVVRAGRVLGSHAFFPQHAQESAAVDVLQAFVMQHYLNKSPSEMVKEIIVEFALADAACVQAALCTHAGKLIKLSHQVRGQRARWLQMAKRTAEQSVQQRVCSRATVQQRLQALQTVLNLAQKPRRIECFDVSHSSGEGTVASCVVFDAEGPVKQDYRRFHISDITPGDDYAAMQQALLRHYSKASPEKLPDIVLIDGGKGQLAQALTVLADLQLDTGILAIGIAKGTSRKAGLEQLIIAKGLQTIYLESDNVALHLLQQIRDEAHRFAITGHRQRRAKKRNKSVLEDITGIGSKRRRDLLRHFGGLQALAGASVEELAKVPGVSVELAQRIFAALH